MRAKSYLSLFVAMGVITVCALLANIAADADWISHRAETVLHVACFAVLLFTIRPYTQRPGATMRQQAASWTLLAAGGLLVVAFAVSNFTSLDTTTNSFWHLLTRTLTFIWFTSPFVFVAINARILEQTSERLNDHVALRTKELTVANHRLQREICERMLVSNELDQAKVELEIALDEKTKELENFEQQILRRERLGAIAEIAAGVSHELNNTLTPIVSYANLLQTHTELPEQQQDWLTRISNSANDAVRVVHDLRQFHYKRTGTNFAATSPGVIAQKAIDATKPIWLDFAGTNGRTISLETHIECDSKIDADIDQMLHLMTNLIMNAIDAIEESDGRIRITTRRDGGFILLEVADNGRGMTLEEIKHCFDPFYSTKSQRTGLGLSACHGIVRRHGGTIDIQTTPGEGTTFRVRLPVADEQQQPQAEPESQKFETQQFDGMRILLVEDSDTVRDALTDLLDMLGATVTPVEGGPAALNKLQVQQFDVLLTDLGLEGMTGIELMAEAKTLCDIPTVLMSGWPRVKVVAALDGQTPPEGLLSKPAKFNDIVAVITEAVGCHQSA